MCVCECVLSSISVFKKNNCVWACIFAHMHTHMLFTRMLSGQSWLQWCPASWKYPFSLLLPAMQWVIFKQLSALHPLSMLHGAIAPTLLPPSHFIFIFILSRVTGVRDNRCKAKLWVAYSLLLYFCSLSNKRTAPTFLPSLYHCFFFCLSVSQSLSLLWPFIVPHPSSLLEGE